MDLERILVIEDDSDDIEVIKEGLEKTGGPNLTIEVKNDGVEAIAYLSELLSGKRLLPQLIFLDMKLPKKGGLEVLEHLKATSELSVIPIVMLTVQSENTEIYNAYFKGAANYLVKPSDYEEFLKKISLTVEYWKNIVESPLD